MKQRELEMALQKLAGFPEPKPELEQYPTPAKIAADMLYVAHGFGDIENRSIIDLGCGTGIFSVGACLLGAAKVTGIDIDGNALAVAAENAEKSGCDIEFVCCPVEESAGEHDTCIMNPPFGSQNRHADLPFLEAAMQRASVVYSLHNSETVGYLSGWLGKKGWDIQAEKNYKLEIRHTFKFHTREKAIFGVTMLRTVKR